MRLLVLVKESLCSTLRSFGIGNGVYNFTTGNSYTLQKFLKMDESFVESAIEFTDNKADVEDLLVKSESTGENKKRKIMDFFWNKKRSYIQTNLFITTLYICVASLGYQQKTTKAHKTMAVNMINKLGNLYDKLDKLLNFENNYYDIGNLMNILEERNQLLINYLSAHLAIEDLYQAQNLVKEITPWLLNVVSNKTAMTLILGEFDQKMEEIRRTNRIGFHSYGTLETWNNHLWELTAHLKEQCKEMKKLEEIRDIAKNCLDDMQNVAYTDISLTREIADTMRIYHAIVKEITRDTTKNC